MKIIKQSLSADRAVIRKIFYSFLFSLFTVSSTHADINSYLFSQDTTSYSSIAGGTAITTFPVNDSVYKNIDIGFTFYYDYLPRTKFSISTNGWISFDTAITYTGAVPISSSIDNDVIAGFVTAMKPNKVLPEIRYEMSGSSGSRVLVIQWKNFVKYQANGLPYSNYNFQIRLYEGTNRIEMIYGQMIIGNPVAASSCQVGLRGASNQDFNNRTTTGKWSLTTKGSSNSVVCALKDTNAIPPGLRFIWNPLPDTLMVLDSALTTQSIFNSVFRRSTNNQIIGVTLVNKGNLQPLHLTSVTLSSKGSSNFQRDVITVKVYYTVENIFSTEKLFNSDTSLSESIKGDIELHQGKEYLWICYDIDSNSIFEDSLDAECLELRFNGTIARVPTVTNPNGVRMINPWEKESDPPPEFAARRNAVAFTIGEKAYVGTGVNSSGFLKDFWEFDPKKNTWTPIAPLPGDPRQSAVGFSIGNKGYVGTGFLATDTLDKANPLDSIVWKYLNDFWEYDPETNSWEQKEPFPRIERYGSFGFSIGSKGYLGGGILSTVRGDFFEYDPETNEWTQKSSLTRYSAAGFSLDGKGYACGGRTTTAIDDMENGCWEYNPDSDSWKKISGSLPHYEESMAAFTIGNEGYVSTGICEAGPIYAPTYALISDVTRIKSAGLSVVESFPAGARSGAVGFTIGSKGYIGMGYNSSTIYNDFWSYNSRSFVDISTSSKVLCSGASVTFNSSYSHPPISWDWTFVGGTPSSSTDPNPAVAYTTSGKYDVTLKITTAVGEVSSVKQQYITVNTPPKAIINTSGSSSCSTPLSAIGSEAGSGTITHYQWFRDGIAIEGANSNSYDAVLSGGYYVVIKNSLGCSSPSNVIAVNNQAAPVAKITGDSAGCNKTSTELSAKSSIPGQGTINIYRWKLDGAVIPGAENDTYVATKSGTYSVYVVNSYGCSSTSSLFPVRFGFYPEVHLGNDITSCDTVMLDAGNSGSVYEWSTGETTQKIRVGKTDTVIVWVKNEAGCIASDTVHVTYKGIAGTIGAPDTVRVNTPVEFKWNGSNATDWKWEFDDGGVSVLENPTYTYNVVGSYDVQLIASNGTCSHTVKKTIIVVAPQGVPEEFSNIISAVHVYPNPNDGKFIVDVVLKSSENVGIKVIDSRGAILYYEMLGKKEHFKREIDLSNYAKGVYHVSVETSKGTILRKIFVQ